MQVFILWDGFWFRSKRFGLYLVGFQKKWNIYTLYQVKVLSYSELIARLASAKIWPKQIKAPTKFGKYLFHEKKISLWSRVLHKGL